MLEPMGFKRIWAQELAMEVISHAIWTLGTPTLCVLFITESIRVPHKSRYLYLGR